VDLEVALSGADHIDWQIESSADGVSQRPRPRDLLRDRGWRVVDAIDICSGVDAYREYIWSSRAEWSVAKHGYVTGQSGWFSCRTACYLAAGRPAVVQDTGLSGLYPTGKGLLTFSTVDDAVAAIEEVEADYEAHADAARAVAAEFFDSDRVLTQLIDDAFRAADLADRAPIADEARAQ
jgi:hypothetical protein